MSTFAWRVVKQLGDQFAIRLRVVGPAGIGTAPVPRAIRYQQLPSALGQALLDREVAIATHRATLRTAVHEHDLGT